MSDIHGQFNKFNIDEMPDASEIDCVIVAGDLTNIGVDYPPALDAYAASASNEFLYCQKFMQRLKNKYRALAWIPGNHDWGFEARATEIPGMKIAPIRMTLIREPRLTIIGESLSTAIDVPHLAKMWAHTTADANVDLEAWRGKSYADIVVSHSPPFGILDVVPGNRHIGSRGLLKYIERHRPKLVIVGHVHECGGLHMNYKGTQIYNVATMWRVIDL